MPAERFESEFHKLLEDYPEIYDLDASTQQLAPLRARTDARPFLADLRMEKSPRRNQPYPANHRHFIEAHKAAWKMIRPGEYEYNWPR